MGVKQKIKKRSPPLLLPRNRAVWPNATIVVILRPHQTLSHHQRMRKLSRKREGRVEADLLREAGLVGLHPQELEGAPHPGGDLHHHQGMEECGAALTSTEEVHQIEVVGGGPLVLLRDEDTALLQGCCRKGGAFLEETHHQDRGDVVLHPLRLEDRKVQGRPLDPKPHRLLAGEAPHKGGKLVQRPEGGAPLKVPHLKNESQYQVQTGMFLQQPNHREESHLNRDHHPQTKTLQVAQRGPRKFNVAVLPLKREEETKALTVRGNKRLKRNQRRRSARHHHLLNKEYLPHLRGDVVGNPQNHLHPHLHLHLRKEKGEQDLHLLKVKLNEKSHPKRRFLLGLQSRHHTPQFPQHRHL